MFHHMCLFERRVIVALNVQEGAECVAALACPPQCSGVCLRALQWLYDVWQRV